MRPHQALLRALRLRRAGHTAPDEADRLIAGGPAGSDDAALRHVLDAVRAPATAGELSGERAMVAALAAERRRAASGTPAIAAPRRTRTVVVVVVTAVTVLVAGGTAVAARTGRLPDHIQQDAHRLFADLGVPAPSTGPARPEPSPSGSRSTRPAPEPSRSLAGSAVPGTPTPAPSAPVVPGDETRDRWCAAWQTAAAGGHPMNGRDRRELTAAAGGEENIAEFCAAASVAPSPPAGPTAGGKPEKSKAPRPTPASPSPKTRSKEPRTPGPAPVTR